MARNERTRPAIAASLGSLIVGICLGMSVAVAWSASAGTQSDPPLPMAEGLHEGADYFELDVDDLQVVRPTPELEAAGVELGGPGYLIPAEIFIRAAQREGVAYLFSPAALDRVLVELGSLDQDNRDLLEEVDGLRDSLQWAEQELQACNAGRLGRKVDLIASKTIAGVCTVVGLVELLRR